MKVIEFGSPSFGIKDGMARLFIFRGFHKAVSHRFKSVRYFTGIQIYRGMESLVGTL